MSFNKNILNIDPERVSLTIQKFIRNSVSKTFKRKGVVVGLSGGIDSTVAAALSVRALGSKRVYGVILPEEDSNPVSREYGKLTARSLNIDYTEIDISPILKAFGVYRKRKTVVEKYFPDISGQFKFRLTLPQDLLERDRINAYHLEVQENGGTIRSARLAHHDYLEMMAANDIKQRTRMTQLYYEAEKRHYIVCGTTNLSEMLQGFFVKFGDGGVDIEPLANLYKSQVFQLGKYLDIPEEIQQRTPSPDTYSLTVSDKEFYFCMPYQMVDMILYSMQENIPKETVARTLGLEKEAVEYAMRDLTRKRESTRHLRMLPPSPDIDG